MAKTNKHKAREKVKEDYEKELLYWVSVTQNEVSQALKRFQERAFNLAVKHSQRIEEIKEEMKNLK